MSLFTIIMDYDGGTYVHQIKALSPGDACRKWSSRLTVSDVYNLGPTGKKALIARMKSDEPVSLDGLENAWCVSAIIRGRLALINVVDTKP
jgi:hypothetical protein